MLRKITIFLLLTFYFVQAGFAQSKNDSGTIRSLSALHELKNAADGREVDLEATVTYADPIWDFVFLQNDGKAVYVNGILTNRFRFGDRVRVEGVAKRGDINPIIASRKITLISSGQGVEPLEIDISNVEFGMHDARFVKTKGTVVQAVSKQGHKMLLCEGNGKLFHVILCGSQKLEQLWKWVGADLTFEGVLGVTIEPGKEYLESDIGSRKILMHRLSCMSSPELTQRQQEPLDATLSDAPEVGKTFIINGQIRACFDDFIVVSDAKKPKPIFCRRTISLGVSDIVRVAGKWARDDSNEYRMEASAIEVCFDIELPMPLNLQELPDDERMWRYAKAVGRPENIRRIGDNVHFEINENGKTTNVVLAYHELTNLDVLKNTKRLAAKGTVTSVDQQGNTELTVNMSENVVLFQSFSSYWKYVAFLPIPISGIFLGGLVWGKIQQNRVQTRAAEIRETQERLVSTFQAFTDGLLAVDSQGQILSVNPEFCEFVEHQLSPGEEFTPDTCSHVFERIENREDVERFIFGGTDSADSTASVQNTNSGHDASDGQQSEILVEVSDFQPRSSTTRSPETRSPTTRSYDLCQSKILDCEGSAEGKLFVLRDRTNERALQNELNHANKIEAVGQLVGGVAHDFNNILTAISANLSFVDIEPNVSNGMTERIEDALVATDRGAELVRRLLSYSGRMQLKPTACSVNKVIRDLHKFAKATFDARYRFDFDLAQFTPYANVDAGALQQVILNLYLNARDAMPDGGTIRTETKLLKDENQTNLVSIRITDTGPGIEGSIREKIFNPFFSTKAGKAGAGLGLSTSRRIIADLDGNLELEKNNSIGSSFVITLPAISDASDLPAPIADSDDDDSLMPRESSGPKRTILVVDDEDSIRKICTMILELHGFNVLTADNGVAALALLETKHDQVDLILLDLTMPGISGIEVMEISQKKYPALPIILCSGYMAGVMCEMETDCMKLPKPFSKDNLIAAINKGLAAQV
jgi:signal transduction histidine kinase/PAS domain-containing protein